MVWSRCRPGRSHPGPALPLAWSCFAALHGDRRFVSSASRPRHGRQRHTAATMTFAIVTRPEAVVSRLSSTDPATVVSSEAGTQSGADFEHARGFGDGAGSGAGVRGWQRLRRWSWIRRGIRGWSGLRTRDGGPGAGFDNGAGHGNGRVTRVELLRGVSDLIAYQPDLLSDRFLPGVDVWDVPIRGSCAPGLRAGCQEVRERRAGRRDRTARSRRLVAEDRTAGACRGCLRRKVVSRSVHHQGSRRERRDGRPDWSRGRQGHR